MRIFPINFNTQPSLYRHKDIQNTCTKSQRDFQSSFYKIPPLNFQANTSAGNPLKKLKGIKCPYFGVEMLSGYDLSKIEKQIDNCSDMQEVINTLSNYKKYMQETEKKIFLKFVEFSKNFPQKTLPDCLKMLYDEAIIKLKLEEFNVLDDVDKISLNLSPQNALMVHAKTTRCRQVILENNKSDTFKRRILLNSLDEITTTNSDNETKILEKLKDRAVYLPTSGTSENAFIVKYAERSQEEIAKRILRPSFATIEHIKPDSLNGENTIGNFLLASSSANSLRSNMPLYKFIEMFPTIPQKCQIYIDQIIEQIHKGHLRKNETYPYKVKRTLEEQSDGKISLDLSKYKYTEEDAILIEKNYYYKYLKKH